MIPLLVYLLSWENREESLVTSILPQVTNNPAMALHALAKEQTPMTSYPTPKTTWVLTASLIVMILKPRVGTKNKAPYSWNPIIIKCIKQWEPTTSRNLGNLAVVAPISHLSRLRRWTQKAWQRVKTMWMPLSHQRTVRILLFSWISALNKNKPKQILDKQVVVRQRGMEQHWISICSSFHLDSLERSNWGSKMDASAGRDPRNRNEMIKKIWEMHLVDPYPGYSKCQELKKLKITQYKI